MLKDIFTFNKKEQNGIFILSSIIIILIISYYIYPSIVRKHLPVYNFSNYKKQIKNFEQYLNYIENKTYDTLFYFDPNKTSRQQWQQLGLNNKQINTIFNFLSKGGKFMKKQDLLKIYGISEKQYKILEPYIIINLKKQNNSNQNIIEPQLFYFDPNTASKLELKKLGLNNKQIQNIENYLATGAKFYSKNDFKKLYSISSQLYNKLEPYIIINKQIAEKSINTPKQKIPYTVELNTADTIQLMKFKGIGKILAKRIIKYRKLLGGYYNIKQLFEVYGLDSSVVKNISKNIIIDTLKIKKININTATIRQLCLHPYINYYEAKAIIKARKILNSYSSINQLNNNKIISEITFQKIKSYLTVK